MENEKQFMSFYIRLGITWNSLGLFLIHNGTNAKRHKNKSHYTTLNCKNGKKKSLMTGHYKTSNLKKNGLKTFHSKMTQKATLQSKM